MKMKNSWLVVGLVAFGSAILTADVITQTTSRAPASQLPAGVLTTETTTHAIVQSINYKTRAITIKKMTGELIKMTAGPEVKRFNEIKKGDTITADYMESVTISIEKAATGQALTQATGQATVRLAGEKPAAVQATTERTTAEVMDVDYTARTITLKGPDGNIVKMNVPDEVKRLNEIKKGDYVITQRTVAVALSVSKI